MSDNPLLEYLSSGGGNDFDVLFPANETSCPCSPYRSLQESGGNNNVTTTDAPKPSPTAAPVEDDELWEILYATGVLIFIFAALISNRVGSDSVMLAALTLFMVANIITVKEGLAGFSNEGVLTVMVLYMVAEGITMTGALDWYMSRLLGRPKTNTQAQMRMMIPVMTVSAFINNTPLVAIMIPVTQRWSKNVNISVQQLLIPLSFAAIFGGTCTIIGTSTNLVVGGLLQTRYGPDVAIGFFDIGVYGVPIAMVGLAIVLLAAPYALPGGTGWGGGREGGLVPTNRDDLLLGARLRPWSPAANRTVKRSGLRDTGGIYLVSVLRATTGNIHRAVGEDFVLNAGDVLYFTGLVEEFGNFSDEYGLEILTSELDREGEEENPAILEGGKDKPSLDMMEEDDEWKHNEASSGRLVAMNTVIEGRSNVPNDEAVVLTKETMLQADEVERSRAIARMMDIIRGTPRDEPQTNQDNTTVRQYEHKVVVTCENPLVVVGVDASDRPGLLMDISKALLRLNLTLHHSEAAVVGDRSISVWRCEIVGDGVPADLQQIWAVLNSFLVTEGGSKALKKHGLSVIRAKVGRSSTLIGKTTDEVDFRNRYKAAVVAIQQKGKNMPMDGTVFGPDDILVLQVDDDSALLNAPPADFYKREAEIRKGASSNEELASASDYDAVELANGVSNEDVWNDLHVTSFDESDKRGSSSTKREFLTAMLVAPKSKLASKTVSENALDKLPGVFLVSIERPTVTQQRDPKSPRSITMADGDVSLRTVEPHFTAITLDTPLMVGDVLWYAGGAQAVGDIRKVPGLISHEGDEVEKMNEKLHDRTLLEAVVARRGPLTGKTVREVRFRTRFGAAVVAIHREGKRMYDHPGNIKLQAGDVLLLEAGSTFIKGSAEHDRSFTLLAEVEDSKPPRLMYLIPALLITFVMIAVATVPSDSLPTLLVCALIASILMVTLGILSEQEARDSINWSVYITVASAFGIGTGLVNSGVAGGLADFLVEVGKALGIGDAGIYGAVYLSTFLVSNVVANNAAAALVFPIAMQAADQSELDVVRMAFIVMFGASASYITPFGYQTNLMVYGPGGYTAKDFFYLGTPVQIGLWLFTTAVISLTDVSNMYYSWVSAAIFLLVVAFTAIDFRACFVKRPSEDGKL